MSVLDIAMTVTNSVAAALPRAAPALQNLQRCRIISHRGEHDNRRVRENTLEAFRDARRAGVWGIECDIRWTADLVPVICHDPTPARVFAVPTPVAQLSFAQLRKQLPQIPSLREVVTEFGGNTHLMLELKKERWPDRQRQEAILQAELSSLSPCEDYHLLALDLDNYGLVEFAPPQSYLPVAELNVKRMSQFALEHGCAGIGGHFLLLGERLRARHANQGQRLGVGFPTSANALRRELNRGIEWIFSNDAVKLQYVLDRHLEAARQSAS